MLHGESNKGPASPRTTKTPLVSYIYTCIQRTCALSARSHRLHSGGCAWTTMQSVATGLGRGFPSAASTAVTKSWSPPRLRCCGSSTSSTTSPPSAHIRCQQETSLTRWGSAQQRQRHCCSSYPRCSPSCCSRVPHYKHAWRTSCMWRVPRKALATHMRRMDAAL